MDFTTNYVNALAQGGRDVQAAQHRNALLEMQQQGQAFNQGIAQQRLGMDQERLQLARDAVTRELANIEATQGAAAAEAERQRNYEMGVAWQTARQAGDMAGLTTVARELGIPVEQLSDEMIDHYDEIIRGTLPVLQGAQSVKPETYKPQSALGKRQADINAGVLPEDTPLQDPADAYGRYVAEEQASGRQPMSRIEFQRAGNLRQDIKVGADGSVRISEGYGDQEVETGLNPSSPEAMVSSIDGILNDPALDYSVGWGSYLQAIPGSPMKRVGARISQLNGQAFLQAFESLKGGGQITEIEGQKATQAIGRLDDAQSPEDYGAALKELRGILSTAITRPKGWVEQQRKIGRDPFPAADIQAMTPDQIRALGPDALQRIPVTELQGLTDEQWDALEALNQ